jgi:hypothetical protein
MDKIKAELTAITEKYKKDFETEINGAEVFKTILDATTLLDKYELKLMSELSDIIKSQSQYIDKNDELILHEFNRVLLIDFRKFAFVFIWP